MNTSNNQQSRQPRVIYVEATIIGILRIRMFRIVIRVYEVRISLICCIDSRCVESRARETVLCHTQLKLSTGYCVMLRSRTPSPHGGWGARDGVACLRPPSSLVYKAVYSTSLEAKCCVSRSAVWLVYPNVICFGCSCGLYTTASTHSKG